jgi:hypothetical protein
VPPLKTTDVLLAEAGSLGKLLGQALPLSDGEEATSDIAAKLASACIRATNGFS